MNYAIDYMWGKQRKTFVVEADDPDTAYEVARDEITRLKLYGAALIGTARVASEADLDRVEDDYDSP